jgi:hypothetical protein
MSDTVLLARLRAALASLLPNVEWLHAHTVSSDSIVFLPEQEVRAATECLAWLGLGQDALALANTWREVNDWWVGPMFDEHLAQWAADSPEEAKRLRDDFGTFPSPEELAASAPDRRRWRGMAVASSLHLAQLIRQLCATFLVLLR